MSQIKCPHCGAMIDEGSRFCPQCGCRVEREARCSYCGAVLKETDRFCPQCGHAVTTAGGTASAQPAAAPHAAGENAAYMPGGVRCKESVEYRKQCPQCGAAVEEDAQRCPKCGYSFGVTSGPEMGQIQCPSCGKLIPDTSRVCPECGCRIDPSKVKRVGRPTSAEASATPGADRPRKKVSHVALAIVIAVIIVLFFIALYFTRRQGIVRQENIAPADTEQEYDGQQVDPSGTSIDVYDGSQEPDAQPDEEDEQQ